MEVVESPTQHSPIYVDVQTHYRVTFDNMKYTPVTKQWEIAVKLEDKKEDRVLGETQITWPHEDPPHTIVYDSENHLLQWENSESLAYLPIKIPARPVYNLSAPHTNRMNPKLLVRPSLSMDSGDHASVAIQRETGWKKLVLSKKFPSVDADAFEAIKEQNFNAILEERLTFDQQKAALTKMANRYEDPIPALLSRLLEMCFFDLSAINAFIVSYYVVSSSKGGKRASKKSSKAAKSANGQPHQNGSSVSSDITAMEVEVIVEKHPYSGQCLLFQVLDSSQVLLSDSAVITLLRCASQASAKELRSKLIGKHLPLNSNLRQRIFTELENEAIVNLLELYTAEFLASMSTQKKEITEVLDLLLFITGGFNDKMLWEENGSLHKRLNSIKLLLTSMNKLSLSMTKMLSTNKFKDQLGNMPPPKTDYRRRRIYVQVLGRNQPSISNEILKRLQGIESLEIPDSSKRIIKPKFITTINKDLQKFGELQAHRKIFGFLGITLVPTKNGDADAMAALGAARASFDATKASFSELRDTVLNSKCLTFGLPKLAATFFDPNDLLSFDDYKELENFEVQINEFINSIYYVIEKRRLDTGFESQEQPTCPTLIDEEKYLVETKDKKPKTYRKKCIGRLRKQMADYAFLSGLIPTAQELYFSAAEQLKSSGDLLWLAGAYEGWATTSLIMQQQNTVPLENYKKIVSKFKSALENYERFSFAAFIEFECVLKTAEAYKQQKMYIETESFLRENVGKYLDDEFTLFNNHIKAKICMISAELYKSIGFIRKYSFYARLAVLFRLHVTESEQKTENDYRIVYPVLYKTLPGYGIQIEDELLHQQPSSRGHVSIQVKTLHEVFMSAQRAGYIEAAIRHLCYILQIYFFHIDDANKLQLIDELKRLVRIHLKKANKISLVDPLKIENCDVVLPPIQMSRFPLITNFRIQPLPSSLAPNILPPDDQATTDVFIYSPFQERDREKKALWVVDNVCQVTVQVQNLLPTELIVHSLILHTEGCDFEAVPVRLNLAASTPPKTHQRSSSSVAPTNNSTSTQPNNNRHSTNSELIPDDPANLDLTPISSSSTEIALLGVPRSPGLLTVTGYSCVVFDMETRCFVQHSSNASGQQKQDLQVQVLPALPKLQLTTSLKRAPVVDDEAGVGEATIFSGQEFTHSIWLQNADMNTSIRWLRCRIIDQPSGFGGPPLIELMESTESDQENKDRVEETIKTTENDQEESDREKMPKPQKPPKKLPNELLFGQLKPLQKKQINIRLFGVDPAYSTGTAQETHVLVRKHQRAHTTMPEIHISRSSNEHDENEDLEDPEEDQQLLERKDSVLSAPAGVGRSTRRTPSSTRTHDLIPYTGRLLTATVEFIYIADIQTENGESYERSERLSLAISIVPALTIIDWQIIAGDSSSTRFVVVDVKNLTTAEAELTFGADQRMISVQPKDLCRVPLLCPCSAEIHASDFQQAAQRASHLMQMQEIDQLRRKLEKHISTHLEIRWKIGALELEGLIPFGPLLASVSFLKQLVVPSISVSVHVNDKPYLNEADIISGVGEMQRMKLKISCVASSSASSFGFPSNSNQMPVVFKGEIALHCFQDLQNGKAPIDRMENLVVCGVQKRPFNLKLNNETDQKSLQTDKSSSLNVFTTSYTFLFRTEGIYKLRPNVQAWRGQTPIQADELFVPTVSFNVVTKLGSSSSLSSNNRQSMVSIKDSPG